MTKKKKNSIDVRVGRYYCNIYEKRKNCDHVKREKFKREKI